METTNVEDGELGNLAPSVGCVVLQDKVKHVARRLYDANPLFAGARDGAVTSRDIALYLFNLRHLLAASQAHIRKGHDQAKAAGNAELAGYFSTKLVEELGHDVWASNDLQELSRTAREAAEDPSLKVLPSIAALDQFVLAIIDDDPRNYLLYALTAEYVAVLIGPDWVADLETHCGIPRSAMSALVQHTELDKDHVSEGLEMIDKFWRPLDHETLTGLLAIVEKVGALYEQFGLEVTREARLAS